MHQVTGGDLTIDFAIEATRPHNTWDLVLRVDGPFLLRQAGRVLFDSHIELASFAAFAYQWARDPAARDFRFAEDMHGYRGCPLLARTDAAGWLHFDWELAEDEGPFPENTVEQAAVRELFLQFACRVRQLLFERWRIDIGAFLTGGWQQEDLVQVEALAPLAGCQP
jgi:hypothetical protein